MLNFAAFAVCGFNCFILTKCPLFAKIKIANTTVYKKLKQSIVLAGLYSSFRMNFSGIGIFILVGKLKREMVCSAVPSS